MEKQDVIYKPMPGYRFWLYDPDGDRMTYYRFREERDAAGARAIEQYLDDGWSEDVEMVSAGEVTHYAQVLNKTMRPSTDDLDEEECDGEGTPWPDGMAWRGTYTLEPMTPNVELTGEARRAESRERSERG